MAAFSFPQNPSNGDTVTNSVTGLTYIFRSLPAPGKWEVQMEDSSSDFVDVTGDAMTGPLDIIPASPILGTSGDASLMVQSSPFSQAAEDQNYVSRVFEAKTNENYTIFSVRDSDATNLPITQGRITAISCYAADTLIHPTLNSITADDWPTNGLRAGLRVGGRLSDGSNGDVLTCTYYETAGTQLQYFGAIDTNNSLVTKEYVDNHTGGAYVPLAGVTPMTGPLINNTPGGGDAINVNNGLFKVATSGVINTKGGISVNSSNASINTGNLNITTGGANVTGGNVTIKATDNNSNGKLVVQNSSGTSNTTLYPTGNILMGSELSIFGTGEDKVIEAFGAGSNQLVLKVATSSESETAVARLTLTDAGARVGGGLVVDGAAGYGGSIGGDLVFPGGTTDLTFFGQSNASCTIYVGPDNGSATRQMTIYQDLLYVHASDFETAGSISAGTTLSSSGQATLGSLQTSTIGGNLAAGNSSGKSGSLQAYIHNCDVYSRLTLPNYIKANTASTATVQVGSKSLFFRNDNNLGVSDPIDNMLGYLNQAGFVWTRPIQMFGSNVAGSDNPNTTGMNNQIQFNDDSSQYGIFYSLGYSQNGFQFYADTSSGTPVKMMNWLLSGDGNKGYMNCYFAPEGSYGLVRKMDLTTSAVTATNLYSSTGTPGTDDYIVTATNSFIDAQCEFNGPQTGSGQRGFTLVGCTTDQPTNTRAVCLEMYHPMTAAAQIKYHGDTTGDSSCIQTKSSTLSLVRGANNTFTGNNTFVGAQVNIGNNSHYTFVEMKGAIRIGASAASEFTGLNNGAMYVTDANGKVSGAYSEGLYTEKKLVLHGTSTTQDILLEGADGKGLNIKCIQNFAQSLVATFKLSGSSIFSNLNMSGYYIKAIGSPIDPGDAANKGYVDNSTANLQSAIHAAVNSSSDYTSLKAALLAALA